MSIGGWVQEETGTHLCYWNLKEAYTNGKRWEKQVTSGVSWSATDVRWGSDESNWARLTRNQPAASLHSSVKPTACQELETKTSVCNIYVDGGKQSELDRNMSSYEMYENFSDRKATWTQDDRQTEQRGCKVTGCSWDTCYLQVR